MYRDGSITVVWSLWLGNYGLERTNKKMKSPREFN